MVTRKVLYFVSGLVIFSSSSVVSANACQTVLCMFGLLNGASTSSECKSPIADYFAIYKIKHGKFSKSRTFKKRGAFLASCPTGTNHGKLINNKYGRVRYF